MELVNSSINLNTKILPISEPMITTYTQHAHLLSILANYDSTYTWIYSNYIQIYINKDYIYNWGDFYFPLPYEIRISDTCKWIKSQKIDRSLVTTKWETIIDFIIDCIDSQNYIHTMINYFYVPISDRYKYSNTNHDILVYGYDLNNKELYVSDFFKNGKYSNEKISFQDFIIAFSKYELATNSDYLRGMVYLYKFDEQCDYKFNIKNITNSIKVYLFSNVPEYWDIYNRDNREDIVFGRDVYKTLKNYASRVMIDGLYIDVRPFYMLYDHKRIMYLRLNYLNEKGYFNTIDNNINIIKVSEIELKARKLVNLIIKYNYSKNTVIIDRIINSLNEIEEEEYDILKQYI